MKILARIAGGIVGFVSVLAASLWIASESGEVVVVTTRDLAGNPHETRLWIVEHEGKAWLRAGSGAQAWYQRLVEQPRIEVLRDGTPSVYTAVPDPGSRDLVNALMLEKHGWADQWISLVFGRDDSVPIRLDPPAAGA